jgi:hypothetical protein
MNHPVDGSGSIAGGIDGDRARRTRDYGLERWVEHKVGPEPANAHHTKRDE